MNYHTTTERAYHKLLDQIIDEIGDDMEDVVVQVTTLEGETIRFSWKDRDKRLMEQNS